MDAPESVPQTVLDDLHERLSRTRLIAQVDGDGRGVGRSRITEVVAAWTRYDWRSHEARIRSLPWAMRGQRDHAVRAVHAPGPGVGTAVVLLHGWPDSVLRYERVLPLLTGTPVVVPALPGFPFFATAEFAGFADVADQLDRFVGELGYDRIVVSAGDVGGSIAEQWAVRHPSRIAALHLTDTPANRLAALADGPLSDSESLFFEQTEQWMRTEGTYLLQQSAKPNTLAVGLGDSPAGLAAWMVEKLDSWTDEPLPLESVLTWLTAYWVTGTIGTSFGAYAAPAAPVAGGLSTPVVSSTFAGDPAPAPRSAAGRAMNVVEWRFHPAGGHWPSWEQPERFVEDLRIALSIASPV